MNESAKNGRPSASANASRDNTRINVHAQAELRQWSQTLGVSEERLKQTVEHVGASIGAVRNALGR